MLTCRCRSETFAGAREQVTESLPPDLAQIAASDADLSSMVMSDSVAESSSVLILAKASALSEGDIAARAAARCSRVIAASDIALCAGFIRASVVTLSLSDICERADAHSSAGNDSVFCRFFSAACYFFEGHDPIQTTLSLILG